jgi:hypothetical protein
MRPKKAQKFPYSSIDRALEQQADHEGYIKSLYRRVMNMHLLVFYSF